MARKHTFRIAAGGDLRAIAYLLDRAVPNLRKEVDQHHLDYRDKDTAAFKEHWTRREHMWRLEALQRRLVAFLAEQEKGA